MYSYTTWKIFQEVVSIWRWGYDSKTNKGIILASINFIYSSKYFDGQLM